MASPALSTFKKIVLVGFSTTAAFGMLMASSAFAADATVASTHAPTVNQEVEERVSLKVTIDRAKVIRIAKTADTIIIGNPAIVDATIQDGKTIVLTGRAFGVTNLIILDQDGEPIVDELIVVEGPKHKTVRIYRQAQRETMACDPVCEPTLTLGDNETSFQSISSQMSTRNSAAGSN
jgi:Flp pilus assembly secretin CpaC